ncbi:receptor-like protein 6 [Lycium barbarum]|uniref:receptor-like protein 6 n=1 Tax=Lycium barbarum TaxID=112863 RepID=UPI00293E5E79|nr:receptor-like protein 6 [Lycium barbarum]
MTLCKCLQADLLYAGATWRFLLPFWVFVSLFLFLLKAKICPNEKSIAFVDTTSLYLLCNGAEQVIGLNLTDAWSSGSINALADLKFLSVILDFNNLSAAPFPDFFPDLSNLTVLSLHACSLTGESPQKIFQIPTLQIIDLIGHNDMLGCSLPEFPSNGSLQKLALSYTQFSGTLPKSIENLRMLSHLDLSSCKFTGPLPSSMANLTQLVYLDLYLNRFTGSLPSLPKNLSHWEKLEYLDLHDNSLSGIIPASLFSLPSLKSLHLSNNFSGQISDQLQNVNSPLTKIYLIANNLERPLPEFLLELKHVEALSLSSNNGTVKLDKFTKLQNLTTLDLSCSGLSVDTNISKSDIALLPLFSSLKLVSCDLQNISFLKNQSSLINLHLSDSHFKGEIPNWIWGITDKSLYVLNLSLNQFTHFQEPYIIPNNLSSLDLYSNLLTGEIPLLPRSAFSVDLSSNKFATSIQPDFGNYLLSAQFLSVANNTISGAIPDSICKATGLEVLDLPRNSLTVRVPTCLAEQMTGLKIVNLG